jgi:hypothetical protein
VTLPAISVHHPWALAVARFGKDVENRGWATRHRGPIAIHATLEWDPTGEQNLLVQTGWINYCKTLPDDNVVRVPLDQDSLWITYGAVVAVADLIGCHLSSDLERCNMGGGCSPWAAEGQWHWELANVRPLRKAVPCKGRQRLWRLPPNVDAAVRADLGTETTA